MTKEEMTDMLEWRFKQAEGKFFPLDNSSLDTLYIVSKGNPRTICGIAQIALELAGTTNQAVTPDIIKELATRRVTN